MTIKEIIHDCMWKKIGYGQYDLITSVKEVCEVYYFKILDNWFSESALFLEFECKKISEFRELNVKTK